MRQVDFRLDENRSSSYFVIATMIQKLIIKNIEFRNIPKAKWIFDTYGRRSDNYTRNENFANGTIIEITKHLIRKYLHSCEPRIFGILKRSYISTIIIMIHRWKRATKKSNINITSPSYGQGYKTYHSLIHNDKLISCFECLSFDKMI